MSLAQLSEVILDATWVPPAPPTRQQQGQGQTSTGTSGALGGSDDMAKNEANGVIMLTTCDHKARGGNQWFINAP